MCPEWVNWSSWTLPSWFLYVATATLFAGTCAFLVKHYAPHAAGSGISEIKCVLGGFSIRGFLGGWTLVIKSLGLPLAIASGLSVGKEGPAVHVACCIGQVVGNAIRWVVPSHAKLRELLTAASAAGVAVAFGSPIGGVLFALEEMTNFFPPSTMWRTFLCALASTVALSFMNPFRTGKLVLFQVEYSHNWHYFEIPFFVLIGLFGGLYGEYVVRFNLQVQRFRRHRLATHGISEAVVLAALTAMIAYFNRFLSLDMTESLELLFRQCDGSSDSDVLCQSRMQWTMVLSLLIATAVRFVLVVLSYGAKVPAGIFIPSMAVGATFGRVVGIMVKALHSAYPTWRLFAVCQNDEPCVTPGTYAVLGAAAGLAGVTRITVAVVVIMFELTGALTYILPIMLVVGTAKSLADACGKGGISDRMSKLNGYPFLEDEDHAFGTNVGALIHHRPDVLYESGMTRADVDDLLTRGTYRGFPVVRSESDDTLIGYIARSDLRYALKQSPPVPFNNPVRFTPAGTEAFALASAQAHGEPTSMLSHTTTVTEQPREEDMEVTFSEDLDLGAWVDPTPLIVQPQTDLEVVSDMFKRMGPRAILVIEYGRLVGIVTIKDLLRYIAEMEHAYSPDETRVDFAIGTGELERLLEIAWDWLSDWARQLPFVQLSTRHMPFSMEPLR